MKMNVILGALSVLVFSSCARNRQAAAASAHSSPMDSLPAIVRALPVKIIPSSEHGALAWTTVSMMESHVSYNPRIAAKLPADVLAFALVHEYGHLQLNHVSAVDFGGKSPASIRKRELEADLFAARFWATNDMKVAQAAAAAFLSPEGRRALRSEKSSEAAGYPTQEERAQAILDYLAKTSR